MRLIWLHGACMKSALASMQMHLPLADRKLILHFLVMRAQQQNDLITGV